MYTRRPLATSAILLILTASSSNAGSVILGNMPQAHDDFGAVVIAGDVRWAMSFTMPPQGYFVDHVALLLTKYNTDDLAAVGFFHDNGSDVPGSPAGGPLLNPFSNSDGLGLFNFTPAAPLLLAASTKYWLVVDATAGLYQWRGSFQTSPTSQVGVAFGKQIGLVGDEPRSSDLRSSFQIIATVPEPSALALLAPAFLAFRHRRPV